MFVVSLCDGRVDCGRTRILQLSIIQHDFDNGLQFYIVNKDSMVETTLTGWTHAPLYFGHLVVETPPSRMSRDPRVDSTAT